MDIKIGVGGVSKELVEAAKKATGDDIISTKEYAQLIDIAMEDGKITKEEQAFIANLDSASVIKQVTNVDLNDKNFDAKTFSFKVKEQDTGLRVNTLVGETGDKLGPMGANYLVNVPVTDENELKANLTQAKNVMENVAESMVSANTANILLDAIAFTPLVIGRLIINRYNPPDPKLDAPPAGLTVGDEYSTVHQIARVARELGVGNCGEKAAATAIDLTNLGVSPVEIFSKPGHEFTVIGRNPKSDPNDLASWGPKAIVVDAWYKEAYPASELASHMDNKGKLPELTSVVKVVE